MRLPRLLAMALTLLGAPLLTSTAQAQTADIVVGPIYEWSNESARGDRLSTEISRADCIAGDKGATVTFDIDVTNANGSFEVWVGSACTDLDSRTQNQCFQVQEVAITADEVTLRVQDMLQAPSAEAGPNTGTAAVCEGTNNQFGGIDLHVFFMLINEGDGATIVSKDIVFKYDITAPTPPSGVTAGPGEAAVEVDFTPPEDDDLAGYRFFCSDVGEPPEPGAGGAGDAAPPATGGCTSSVLVAGQDPPVESIYACGSSDSAQATHGTATGRPNGVSSVVAIASLDEYGNLGKLSALVCSTPKEITGYFEAYRAAGGQGGGGFCGFAPPRRGALAVGLALLLGCVALGRRRR